MAKQKNAERPQRGLFVALVRFVTVLLIGTLTLAWLFDHYLLDSLPRSARQQAAQFNQDGWQYLNQTYHRVHKGDKK